MGKEVRGLLEEVGMKASDLLAVAVGIGPGSYTGTRTGMTFAKVLAFACGIPLFGRSGLEVLAFEAAEHGPCVGVMMPGHKDRIYGAAYDFRQSPPKVVLAPGLYEPKSFQETLGDSAQLVRDPSLDSPEDLSASDQHGEALHVSAASLVRLVAKLIAVGVEADDPGPLEPLYLQASAPERLRAGSRPFNSGAGS
jgi:tRNA threonylcarbamoyl adenosine modification protein YeaZ